MEFFNQREEVSVHNDKFREEPSFILLKHRVEHEREGIGSEDHNQ